MEISKFEKYADNKKTGHINLLFYYAAYTSGLSLPRFP